MATSTPTSQHHRGLDLDQWHHKHDPDANLISHQYQRTTNTHRLAINRRSTSLRF